MLERRKQLVSIRKAICTTDASILAYNMMIAASVLMAIATVIEFMVVDNVEDISLFFSFFLLMYNLQAKDYDIYLFRNTRPTMIRKEFNTSSRSVLYDTFSILPIRQRDVREIAFYHWLQRFAAIGISIFGLNIAVLVRDKIFYMREWIALYSLLVITLYVLVYYSSISMAGHRSKIQKIFGTVRIVGIIVFAICMFLSLLLKKQVLQMMYRFDSHIGLGNLSGMPLIIITIFIFVGSFFLFYKGTYQKSRISSWRV